MCLGSDCSNNVMHPGWPQQRFSMEINYNDETGLSYPLVTLLGVVDTESSPRAATALCTSHVEAPQCSGVGTPTLVFQGSTLRNAGRLTARAHAARERQRPDSTPGLHAVKSSPQHRGSPWIAGPFSLFGRDFGTSGSAYPLGGRSVLMQYTRTPSSSSALWALAQKGLERGFFGLGFALFPLL